MSLRPSLTCRGETYGENVPLYETQTDRENEKKKKTECHLCSDYRRTFGPRLGRMRSLTLPFD